MIAGAPAGPRAPGPHRGYYTRPRLPPRPRERAAGDLTTTTPIRDAIAAAAKARGLTQADLAIIGGTHRSLISSWLRGERRLHSGAIERLAAELLIVGPRAVATPVVV